MDNSVAPQSTSASSLSHPTNAIGLDQAVLCGHHRFVSLPSTGPPIILQRPADGDKLDFHAEEKKTTSGRLRSLGLNHDGRFRDGQITVLRGSPPPYEPLVAGRHADASLEQNIYLTWITVETNDARKMNKNAGRVLKKGRVSIRLKDDGE